MSRYAVIDIGTNSVKMYVARVMHGRISPLDEQLSVSRLGEGLAATGELSETAMDRTVEAIRGMVEQAEALGVDKIVAVGTAALRKASNPNEFMDLVKKRCKLKVEVITGRQEAEMAAAAVRTSLDVSGRDVVIFDIGGGSTEIIRLTDGEIKTIESLDIGVRTLLDKTGITDRISPEQEDVMQNLIIETVGGFRGHADMLIGLGGTFTSLAALQARLPEFDSSQVHDYRLSRRDVENWYSKLADETISQRCRNPALHPRRADVIPVGAAIALELMICHEAYEIVVCARGLRHGVFMSRFAGIQ
jgi:exopolyphosphatase / guanosine-5'-triphosphate,3'-diphosphate pyrophosphatase